MTRFRMLPGGLDELARDPAVAALLGACAEEVRRRVRAPSRMTLAMRAGVGPRGAYGQVTMRGPGAIAAEYGSRHHPPGAHLRAALRGGR